MVIGLILPLEDWQIGHAEFVKLLGRQRPVEM